MNRRQLLLTVGGILPAVSGCLGSGAAPGEATDTPTESPTPADACERDLERIDPWWTVESGPLDGFDLSVSKDSVPIGGTLTVELTNVTDERRTSGSSTKYDIERQTADGWESIFWKYPYEAWTAEGVFHQPDEGFTWELTVTKDGLSETGKARPDYFVCTPLRSGTYRFIYWGVVPEKQRGEDTDYALGTQFTVTEG